MRELTAADRSSTTAAGCANQAWVLNLWAARRSNIARSVSCVVRSPLEDRASRSPCRMHVFLMFRHDRCPCLLVYDLVTARFILAVYHLSPQCA